MNGKGISNLHPERLEKYGKDGYFDDTHPFSPDALGQWWKKVIDLSISLI